jgi:WhiB family redox-sensing transcriptional regulator
VNLDWMDNAACKDEDPEKFFPSGTGVKGQRQAAAAERICRGCPVRVECQAQKRSTGSTSGVWGGRGAVRRKS